MSERLHRALTEQSVALMKIREAFKEQAVVLQAQEDALDKHQAIQARRSHWPASTP